MRPYLCLVKSTPLAFSALLVLASATTALADEPSAPAMSPSATAPAARGQGVGVIGIGSTRDEAFALGRAVYGSRLRPGSLDEPRARVLAGDPPPAQPSPALRDLAELRAAIKGDDAASRRLLLSITKDQTLEALLVVDRIEPASTDADASAPVTAPVRARLFLPETGEFDAAVYTPEAGASGPAAWRTVVTSLERRFPPSTAPMSAPSAAVHPPPPPALRPTEPETRPFYKSFWFWGAIGGAALVGTGIYFASRDTGPDAIHLQMRIPK